MMSLNLKLDLLECEMSSSETSHTSNGGATSESSRSASVSPGMFSSFRKLSEMWHPHVYAQPPKKPTPFSINDILQQENEESSQKQTARQPQYPFHLQQNSIMSILGGNPLGLTMGVKQIEVATAMRSLVAALSASAPAAVHSAEGSSPSPPSTCGSPGRISGTPSTEDDVDQPLNLTTSNKPHLSDSDLSSGMKGLKRKKESLSKYEDSLSADEDSKKKKVRTTFTGRQIFELEKMFESKKYLSSSERSDMAKLLNVTEQQVKIWFQNRRTKWKKQENISNAEAAELMKSKSIKETSPSSQTAPSMKSKSSHSSMGNLTEKGPSPHQGSISPPTSFIRPSSSTSSHSMPGLERLTSSSGGQHKIFHYPESSLHGEDFDNSSDVDDDDDVDNDDDEEDRLVIEEQGTSSDCQNNNNSFGGSQKEILNSGLLTNTLS